MIVPCINESQGSQREEMEGEKIREIQIHNHQESGYFRKFGSDIYTGRKSRCAMKSKYYHQ